MCPDLGFLCIVSVLCFPVFPGCHAGYRMKRSVKSTRVVKTTFQRNFRYGEICPFQKIFGIVGSQAINIFPETHFEECIQFPGKIAFAYPQFL